MPSLGHVAVGLAGAKAQARGRLPLRSVVVLTALATFPDLDVFFPAAAGPVWAHRGALHSLAAAVVAAAIATLLLDLRCGRGRTFLIALAAAASHGLLDVITHGGEGVMLLWPFSRASIFSPWHLLPASPLAEPFSVRGVMLMLAEALLFAPLVVYALWPRRVPVERPAERST